MTREVPEKMLTAFQVVFVTWTFLLRTRPVASGAVSAFEAPRAPCVSSELTEEDRAFGGVAPALPPSWTSR